LECEMCGNPIHGKPIRVRIEGTVMSTCKRCARFGVEEEVRRREAPRHTPGRARPAPKKEFPEELELAEDCGARIKQAREKRGMTQEELGNLLNERASVIARLESQRIGISGKMARKIEKLLDIKLFEELE